MSTKPRASAIFRRYRESGRCASREAFSDATADGRSSWVEEELARLSEDPARAA
jgi:hypothetical protein